MKKKINLYNPKEFKQLELYQKLKNKSKIKLLNKNKKIIKAQIKDLLIKKDNAYNHFNSVSNNLLQYSVELQYKINKKIYKPEIIKKEKYLGDINKNNLKSLKNLQEIHLNKLIDDKYTLEKKAIENFKKENERENKLITEHINKDHMIYEDLNIAKRDLSLITKKLRKQVIKTENKENDCKDLKLNYELTKKINIELTNILNKEKRILQKLLVKMNKKNKEEDKKCYSDRVKKVFINQNKSNSFKSLLINNNEFINLNQKPKTPRNNKITINNYIHDLNIYKYKSPNKNISKSSSKKFISRNNYISTTLVNSTSRNKIRLNTGFLSEGNVKEKIELNEFSKVLRNEIKLKEEKIKIFNCLINEEFHLQYIIKNFCLECINDIKKDIKYLNLKKFNVNEKNNDIKIKENETYLNIFNFIIEKCCK